MLCACSSQIRRRRVFDPEPNAVRFPDIPWHVFSPFSLNILVQVQIEFPIDDFPRFGIRSEFFSPRNAKGAVTAVGRDVFLGVRFEFFFVVLAGKQISDPIKLRRVMAIAAPRLALREVCYGVIAADPRRAVLDYKFCLVAIVISSF